MKRLIPAMVGFSMLSLAFIGCTKKDAGDTAPPVVSSESAPVPSPAPEAPQTEPAGAGK